MVFDTSKPIYLQIVNLIQNKLINNEYLPGEKIPSVRDLAMEMKVNSNTVQKALQELEKEGFLISERTTGRFVTKDDSLIQNLKANVPEQITKKYISDMNHIGYDISRVLKYIQNYIER